MIHKAWFSCNILFFIMLTNQVQAGITFNEIKNRRIYQYELTDIMLDLAQRNEIFLLERWKELSPKSFQKLDFPKAYLLAAEKSEKLGRKNQALMFYIKAYQWIDKKNPIKIEVAYKASFLLYSQKKRSEALFYINRAIEDLKHQVDHRLAEDIFYLKRRIVWRYFSRMDALPDNAINTVAFDGDDVWVGMWSGAVARYNRSASILDLFNTRNTKLPSPYIRDILIKPDKVWIATHSGLAYYQKSDGSWHNIIQLYNYKLKRLIYHSNSFYVATLFNGVYKSSDGVSWKNIVPNKSVLDLIMVDNDLYIATPENGVFVYQDGSLKSFLSNISAKTIILDHNPRYLWIGTYGQGLLKVDRKTARIDKAFTSKHIKSNYIESLLLIDDKLWVGTLETGVSVYNISQNTWFYFGLKDGMPGLDITTITREKDHLWFGTLAGGIGIYLFKELNPLQGVTFD